jgi:hypothetical protein
MIIVPKHPATCFIWKGHIMNQRLTIETETTIYRIYPTMTHFVLIDERMAADVVVKLCPLARGVESAIDIATNWIKGNEQS